MCESVVRDVSVGCGREWARRALVCPCGTPFRGNVQSFLQDFRRWLDDARPDSASGGAQAFCLYGGAAGVRTVSSFTEYAEKRSCLAYEWIGPAGSNVGDENVKGVCDGTRLCRT